MKKFFTFVLLFMPLLAYASPYADDYLYEDMLEYIENPEKYSNNITNGYVKDNKSSVIIGAYIEKAYDIYQKEELYTPEIKKCGDLCYKLNNAESILSAYHKFFYMYAIADEITGSLLYNPQENEDIEYILRNKYVSYKWYGLNKLVIKIDDNVIDFIKDSNGVTIKTDMQSLKKYRLQ